MTSSYCFVNQKIKILCAYLLKVLLFISMLISSHSYSADLQCESSYKIFEGIYNDINSVRDGANLNLTQLARFEHKYSYSRLFDQNHPGQVYSSGNWIDQKVYADQVLMSHLLFVKLKTKNLGVKWGRPKANFISDVGEICIIPFEYRYSYLDESVTQRTDNIYVRNLKNNEWRVFIYLGYERKQDFDEFFPDFPKTIKLSEIYSSEGNSIERYIAVQAQVYKALGIELTAEKIENMRLRKKAINERRKENGF